MRLFHKYNHKALCDVRFSIKNVKMKFIKMYKVGQLYFRSKREFAVFDYTTEF